MKASTEPDRGKPADGRSLGGTNSTCDVIVAGEAIFRNSFLNRKEFRLTSQSFAPLRPGGFS
jgi:hypothetical protein